MSASAPRARGEGTQDIQARAFCTILAASFSASRRVEIPWDCCAAMVVVVVVVVMGGANCS